MYLALVLLSLLAAPLNALPSWTLPVGHGCTDEGSSPIVKNANHIFNAIHSSMRQWGSSLHHNGMSFFLAEIPAGTELYHGRGDNITVKGFEWLAFEPEHAMNFARKLRPRSPKDGKPPPDHHGEVDKGRISRRDDLSPADHAELRHQQLLRLSGESDAHDEPERKPPIRRPGDDYEIVPGWLHAYKMKFDLRVVYIDGEAAAKSHKGTLDSQDYVLAPASGREGAEKPGFGPGGEYRRAKQMCDMAANEWHGRIDGFIRMEHGFELILCDFEKSADLIRMVRVGQDKVVDDHAGAVSTLAFLKAIGARYHSIGGERVKLDYENFVTAFAADLNLFHHADSDLPRLDNITQEQRTSLLADLTDLIVNPSPVPRPTNWQSIADMIIARYGDPLHAFAFDHFASKQSLDYSLTLLLRPFIDYDARDTALETARCTAHFLPSTISHTSTAGTAISRVSSQICTTLFSALSFSGDSSLERAQARLAELVAWLRWTSWKECRPGCAWDEFCLTAIWPIGDTESHERPYCVNATSSGTVAGRPGRGDSYWDGMGGPHA